MDITDRWFVAWLAIAAVADGLLAYWLYLIL
jgi:hypothetical protein